MNFFYDHSVKLQRCKHRTQQRNSYPGYATTGLYIDIITDIFSPPCENSMTIGFIPIRYITEAMNRTKDKRQNKRQAHI